MAKFLNFLNKKSAAHVEEYYKDRTKKSLLSRLDNFMGRTPDPARIPRPSHTQAILSRVESELDTEERALANGGESWRAEQMELNEKAELNIQKIKRQKEARPYGNGNQEWLKAYENEVLLIAWVDLLKAERLWTQTTPLRWPSLAESGFLRTGVKTEPSRLAYNSTIILDGRQDFRVSPAKRLMHEMLPLGHNVGVHPGTGIGHDRYRHSFQHGSVEPLGQSTPSPPQFV